MTARFLALDHRVGTERQIEIQIQPCTVMEIQLYGYG